MRADRAVLWPSRLLLGLFALLLAAQGPEAAFAEPETLTAEQVNHAIQLGVKYLAEQQSRGGAWTENPAYHGGATPLVTLALLNSGRGPDDEVVKKALAYLRRFRPETTYTFALQTMVFCAAEPRKDLLLIRRNAKWLEDQQIKEGPRAGMWSYPNPGAPNRGDNSNTQFAILALYEAERAGVTVSGKTWKLALDHWQRTQNPDGSWGYEPNNPGTGSMTNAGIASTIIASGQLSGGDAKVDGDQVQCCGEQLPNEPVENGLAWLNRNFAVRNNPGTQHWLFYYLYGLERTGRMTARRFIGSHDWYREGAQLLVREQLPTGAWPDVNRSEDAQVSTSFALLFLAKGRRPVILGDLKHGPDEDWNHHRSALFNLVSYIEQAWHYDLTYQVIDPKAATVEDLLETPVLYISGRDAPQFGPEEKLRLRQYIDRGGFIFAEQCCGGGNFDRGFRELVKEIFPEPDLKLRPLSIDHPAWYAEERVDPAHFKELWGVDVGCRTSLIYCPNELSCFWELARPGRERQYSEAVQAQIKAAQAVGINVLAYATNREVKPKLEGLPTPAVDPQRDSLDRDKMYVALVQHPGGCNAAPSALSNLLRVAAEKVELRAGTDAEDIRELRLTDKQLFNYHLVFMHGRSSFSLTPAERKALKTYLERGGMLFADSICSSKQFTDSFRREMKSMFPARSLERIPVSHPLFKPDFGGDDLSSVSRRQPETTRDRDPLKAAVRQGEPYLEGLELGDRYAVIFSPYDLSCALESHESLECEGYIRADAARIGINVLLYSLHQ